MPAKGLNPMETNTNQVIDAGWHMDKRIPIALIATLVLQTAAIVWWAATLQSSTSQNVKDIVSNRVLIDRLDTRSQQTTNTMTSLSTKVDMMTQTLDRQTRVLDDLSKDVNRLSTVKP